MKENKKIKLSRTAAPKNPNAGAGVYKPKVTTQEDMQKGFSRAMSGVGKQPGIGIGPQQKIDVRPLSQRQPPSQRQPEQYPSPRVGKPQVPDYWHPQPPAAAPAPEAEAEEPYWSAEEWESWAFQLYHHYSDTRQFLPEWFIEAVESESK